MQLSISLKSITNVLKLSIAMILKVALVLSQERGLSHDWLTMKINLGERLMADIDYGY